MKLSERENGITDRGEAIIKEERSKGTRQKLRETRT
jgi:hypothetical protein